MQCKGCCKGREEGSEWVNVHIEDFYTQHSIYPEYTSINTFFLFFFLMRQSNAADC